METMCCPTQFMATSHTRVAERRRRYREGQWCLPLTQLPPSESRPSGENTHIELSPLMMNSARRLFWFPFLKGKTHPNKEQVAKTMFLCF